MPGWGKIPGMLRECWIQRAKKTVSKKICASNNSPSCCQKLKFPNSGEIYYAERHRPQPRQLINCKSGKENSKLAVFFLLQNSKAHVPAWTYTLAINYTLVNTLDVQTLGKLHKVRKIYWNLECRRVQRQSGLIRALFCATGVEIHVGLCFVPKFFFWGGCKFYASGPSKNWHPPRPGV